jgi:hypothetical protein
MSIISFDSGMRLFVVLVVLLWCFCGARKLGKTLDFPCISFILIIIII